MHCISFAMQYCNTFKTKEYIMQYNNTFSTKYYIQKLLQCFLNKKEDLRMNLQYLAFLKNKRFLEYAQIVVTVGNFRILDVESHSNISYPY